MSPETAAPPRKSRRYRVVRALFVTAALLALTVTSVNCAANYLVHRTDAKVPRNPETGIMLGAEERDLGPADAPGVAILVHGYIGAGDNFDGLPEAIAAAGWRVRVMRLPGHGTSPIDFEKISPDELIDAVRDEVVAMRAQHKHVVLVSHSMGGTISTIVAARQPVDGLVLGAPYYGVTQKWYYLLPVKTWVRVGSPFIKWLYKGQYFMQVNRPEAKDDITSYAWVGMNSVQTLMTLGEMARDPAVLARIDMPILLIHSHIDEAADPQAAEEVFEQLPSEHKQMIWLERSNHHIFWDYEAEELESAILTFLQSIQVSNETQETAP